jgi:hypothetical protein
MCTHWGNALIHMFCSIQTCYLISCFYCIFTFHVSFTVHLIEKVWDKITKLCTVNLYFKTFLFYKYFLRVLFHIENMVWLCWSLSHLPRQLLKPGTWVSKGSYFLLSQPLKAQDADLNPLWSAVLRPRWPQTIPCSCLPVAWITGLSHQYLLSDIMLQLYFYFSCLFYSNLIEKVWDQKYLKCVL